MEKLIELLRERKPNFDENHILDMMYSEGIIFIKDGKPVYTYDKIFPNSERMIINGKLGFIKRLVENEKIDKDKVKENCIKRNGRMDVDGLHRYSVYERVLMLLSISDTPIDDLIKLLK